MTSLSAASFDGMISRLLLGLAVDMAVKFLSWENFSLPSALLLLIVTGLEERIPGDFIARLRAGVEAAARCFLLLKTANFG